MHNIEHWSLDENCDRRAVLWDIGDYAAREGDGYSGPMHWHDEVPPLKNREEAEKWIEAHDKGWYDDHAVRYYDYSGARETKKTEELNKRAKAYVEKIAKYQQEHSVSRLKAEFIGCSGCGSRVAKKYLRGERCPVCGKDLRSATTLAKLKEYEDKKNELLAKMKEEREKQSNIRKVRWLVKFEFHS